MFPLRSVSRNKSMSAKRIECLQSDRTNAPIPSVREDRFEVIRIDGADRHVPEGDRLEGIAILVVQVPQVLKVAMLKYSLSLTKELVETKDRIEVTVHGR